jgi:hypothetical protein
MTLYWRANPICMIGIRKVGKDEDKWRNEIRLESYPT